LKIGRESGGPPSRHKEEGDQVTAVGIGKTSNQSKESSQGAETAVEKENEKDRPSGVEKGRQWKKELSLHWARRKALAN